MKFQDLTGRRFGRLTVLTCVQKSRVDSTGYRHHTKWLCLCDCGKEAIVKSARMKNGETKSCGCLHSEVVGAINRTHGLSHLAEYRIWAGIVRRVTDKMDPAYHRYGGRGIQIDPAWCESFEAFYSSMGSRPSSDYSIERKDNDGPYAPWNCIWDTRETQSNNTSKNVRIGFNGETKTLAQWCREYGHIYATISGRISRYGWSVDRALTTPSGRGRGGNNREKNDNDIDTTAH